MPAGMPSHPPVPEGTVVEGMRTRPGLAMSQDARNWARIEGDHHTGLSIVTGYMGKQAPRTSIRIRVFFAYPIVLAGVPLSRFFVIFPLGCPFKMNGPWRVATFWSLNGVR